MFEGADYPKSLDEKQFDDWLEQGRSSKIPYRYLLIVWDAFDAKYQPVYTEDREAIDGYEVHPNARGHESLIAVYDLHSESRIGLMA